MACPQRVRNVNEQDDDAEELVSLLGSRVADLESRYTHLQRVVDELNEVLIAQSRRIDQLERRVSQFVADVSAFTEPPAEPRKLEDEKPPHY